MKIKNNVIAIAMTGILLFSCFVITPAIGSITKSNKLSKLVIEPYVDGSRPIDSTSYRTDLLTQGFEDGVMPPPGGWYTSELNTNPVHYWMVIDDPDYVYNGIYSSWINYDSSNQSDNWLVSPNINLTGYVKANLTFWAASDTNYTGATMKLYIRGDGINDTIWDMIQDEIWPQEQFEYREKTFDLSSYVGQTINISWRYVGLDGDSFGLDDISVMAEVSNQPPVANYTYKLNDLNVTFTSTSSDPDGNIVNWTWNFDDVTPLSFKPNPQHSYVGGKIYNVTLTVKDDEGASNSITKKITVTNNPPIAEFVYSLVGGSKHVRFDASNSSDLNGTIVSYFWEFGDGKNSTDMIVGHDYEQDYTTYKVNLTVTDSAGLNNTISKNVIIGDVTSPTIKITKPVKKTIYINDKIKRQRLLGMSIIIGDITIEVDAKDNNGSGIAKVDFYINGKLKGNDTTEPYNYTWTKDRLRVFHLFTIKVVAYDKAGNKVESKMIVRKIL